MGDMNVNLNNQTHHLADVFTEGMCKDLFYSLAISQLEIVIQMLLVQMILGCVV